MCIWMKLLAQHCQRVVLLQPGQRLWVALGQSSSTAYKSFFACRSKEIHIRYTVMVMTALLFCTLYSVIVQYRILYNDANCVRMSCKSIRIANSVATLLSMSRWRVCYLNLTGAAISKVMYHMINNKWLSLWTRALAKKYFLCICLVLKVK